jgi:hypothetical protein
MERIARREGSQRLPEAARPKTYFYNKTKQSNYNMFRKILLAGLLCCPALWATAQLNVRNTSGTFITNTGGTEMRVEGGGIVNDGTITNEGNIYLDSDYVQATPTGIYFGAASSWLWFEGAGLQNITTLNAPDMGKIRVDNGNKLNLLSNVEVSVEMDLRNNGNVQLNNFNLDMLYTGIISNYDLNHYIITNGMGLLRRGLVPGDIKIYPAGNTTYNPLELFSTGGNDDMFGLRVEDAALVSGTTGAPEANDHVGRTWHLSEAVAGGNNMDFSVEWDATQELPNFNRNSCGVKHWDGAAWDVPNYSAAVNVSGTRYQQSRTGQTTFSPFAVIDDNLLPIELLDFAARRLNIDKVQLDWATATEWNNSGFWLQRQLDTESEFRNIAWIAGAGNSTTEQYYDYEDANAHSGVSYYRLQQVDISGETSYSLVRAVSGETAKQGAIALFPNPTTDQIYVRFDATFAPQNATFTVFAADGKRLFDVDMAISAHTALPIANTKALAAGMYLMRIQLESGAIYTQKFEKITP